MRLEIITLSWEGLDKLQTLRKGFIENAEALGCDFTWHIRDNGSKDGTVEEISKWEHVEVYDIGHNRDSFAAGCNYLVDQANPADDDLLLMLNNDLEFFKDDQSIVKMHNLMKKTDAGMVGCRLLYSGTTKLQHSGVIFSKKYNSLPYHYRPGEESDKQAKKDREFQAITAACCIIKAGDYKKVCENNKSGCNGLNERYFWSFEDIDACLSVKYKLGKKIMYCGDTNIYHEESATLKINNFNKLMVNSNVKTFKELWSGKYVMDLEKYENNSGHNVII